MKRNRGEAFSPPRRGGVARSAGVVLFNKSILLVEPPRRFAPPRLSRLSQSGDKSSSCDSTVPVKTHLETGRAFPAEPKLQFRQFCFRRRGRIRAFTVRNVRSNETRATRNKDRLIHEVNRFALAMPTVLEPGRLSGAGLMPALRILCETRGACDATPMERVVQIWHSSWSLTRPLSDSAWS